MGIFIGVNQRFSMLKIIGFNKCVRFTLNFTESPASKLTAFRSKPHIIFRGWAGLGNRVKVGGMGTKFRELEICCHGGFWNLYEES